MNDPKLKCLLYIVWTCLVQTSCMISNMEPAKFDYERYRINRVWPMGRVLDPVTDSNHVLDFLAIVNQFGYPVEEHWITTVDGYKLRLHRIPGNPRNPKANGKPVVYFQHGILFSSDSWILRGPNKDLAYILADAGFDVWFGNIRGNIYSRAHVSLSADHDPEFWDFSWHEAAMFDVSRMIDYILTETGREKLVYVGHSMGSTMIYALLSTRAEYNERVELVISLAPVAFWGGQPSPFISFLRRRSKSIKNFLERAQIYEILPRSKSLVQIFRKSCNTNSIFQPLCLNTFSFVTGHNPKELNVTMFPYYLSYLISGCSRKMLIHFDQNMKSGDFQMFDYGLTQNLIIYKSEKPPHYNLNNITAPVAIFYGKGDALVSQQDPLVLAQKLPNVVYVESIRDEQFTHTDFLFANNLKSLLLDQLMEMVTNAVRNEIALRVLA